MLKERIKSSVIILLIINVIFLTSEIWFVHGSREVGGDFAHYLKSLKIAQVFFPVEVPYSIPKENLSLPRKFLINDGSLWMAYYNTDIGFSPIEERTRTIIKGFLHGDITASKKIDRQTWNSGLESFSIYVEYPIEFSRELFSKVMDTDPSLAPDDISSLRDFVIIPSSDETDICLLVHDCGKSDGYYAYILDSKYQFPSEDLIVYANSGDGYYEPAFSTGLAIEDSNVSLSPLVLFSDSQPESDILLPRNLLNHESGKKILEVLSFNGSTNPYKDKHGTMNYIENYASLKLYNDSVFEYICTSDDKGILLDESGDAYRVLNSAIDFAEKIWKCVSDKPLNVLLTSDLSNYDSKAPFKFKFDYYCNGRPVALSLDDSSGHEKLSSAIEMTVVNGKLISYRQYMCQYDSVSSKPLDAPFLSSLDWFVKVLSDNSEHNIINDIYIGYLDCGDGSEITADWLAKVGSENKIYRYSPNAEVKKD